MQKFESKTMKLKSNQICSDSAYQRPLNTKLIKDIVDTFNPNRVRKPLVSFRDGKYWVFDGQHTIAALVQRNDGKPVTIECEVFYGMTQVDEAELFLQQRDTTRIISSMDKIRTKYKMGYPDTVAMVKAVEKSGLKMGFNTTHGRDNITCATQLTKSWKELEPDAFTEMLTVLKMAYHGDPDGVQGQIIGGMTAFYKVYYRQFKPKDLAKKLELHTPRQILAEARSIGDGNIVRARVILRIYNTNRSTGRLPDKL